MKGDNRADALLLIAGLTCAVLGQVYVTFYREYVWDGALFWGAAILMLVLLMRRVRRGQTRKGLRRLLVSLSPVSVRSLMITGGVCLTLVAGLQARQRLVTDDFTDLLALWVVGVGAYIAAFMPSGASLKSVWLRCSILLKTHWKELIGLVGLLVLASAVRTYDLEHIPANLGGDEGTWAMEGLAMLDGHLANPFGTRWFAFPSMSFLVWGLSMRVFGETVAGLRMASALIGTVSVLSTFVLARELWGRRVAWLAAVFLTVGHYHLHFSRLAVNNIADSFLVPLALYSLVLGLRSGRSLHFALAGVIVGAGWYGYFGARLLGVIVSLYLAWRALAESRFLERHRPHLLVLLGAAAVVVVPLMLHYSAHPSALSEGVDRVSIFASGWLAREQVSTGRTAVSLLFTQFWKSISAFNYTLDPTFWYGADIPLLDVVSGLFFVLGLVWCTGRWRWPSNALLLIWFWSALITGWVMTENPPSSQRLVGTAPALAIFVALGLDWVGRMSQRILNAPRVVWQALSGALLVAVLGLNLSYYFLVYTPKRVYGNPTAEMATHLSRYLMRQNDDLVVYLHGPPFIYWDFGTFRFMARDVDGVDVPPPAEADSPQLEVSDGARFVFHPARVDELEAVRARHPGGSVELVRSRASEELLYAMYEVNR